MILHKTNKENIVFLPNICNRAKNYHRVEAPSLESRGMLGDQSYGYATQNYGLMCTQQTCIMVKVIILALRIIRTKVLQSFFPPPQHFLYTVEHIIL